MKRFLLGTAAAFAVFFGVTYLLVRLLEMMGLFLRL